MSDTSDPILTARDAVAALSRLRSFAPDFIRYIREQDALREQLPQTRFVTVGQLAQRFLMSVSEVIRHIEAAGSGLVITGFHYPNDTVYTMTAATGRVNGRRIVFILEDAALDHGEH